MPATLKAGQLHPDLTRARHCRFHLDLDEVRGALVIPRARERVLRGVTTCACVPSFTACPAEGTSKNDVSRNPATIRSKRAGSSASHQDS